MHRSFSFRRTKSKCLGASTRNWGDCCCFGVYTTAVRCSVFTWCLRKKGPIFVVMFSPLSIVIAMIMGVTFLVSLEPAIISFGFYMVLWGQTKEKNKLLLVTNEDLDVSGSGSSVDETIPLLSSRYQ
ncbi:hypothetical protein Hanom_Chr17g01553511 [Helianthus anomalus]